MAAQRLLEKANFSIDQPFGIKLDDYFSKGYELVTGGRPIDSFVFQEGVTPLSTQYEVAMWTVTYLFVIFGGRQVMKNQDAFKLKHLFILHNFLLTVASGALLMLFVENLVPILARHGLFYAICDDGAWTQRLELLYYLNYLVKYWELADTVFLVLKKKPLEFLHYFHHSMTMILCFVQLGGHTSVSWVPITLNLTVHVLMYYYYMRSAAGVRIWWKQYLTTLQIVQFILDLGFIYFCSYTYFAFTYAPHLPNAGKCAGTEGAALFGCGLLSSYLLLFINFYRLTYNAKQQQQHRITNMTPKAVKSSSGSSSSKKSKSKHI
ncbi:MAG: fatty acid elongase [Linnemannia gamsii]|nr:MAG: fatty acid elongase [Linnemannia gamsii]